MHPRLLRSVSAKPLTRFGDPAASGWLIVPVPAGIVVDALSVVVNGTSGLTTIEKDAGGLLVGVRTSVAGHAVAVRFDVHAESSTSARVQAAGHAPRVVIGVDPDRARVVIDEVFDRLEKWSESASL